MIAADPVLVEVLAHLSSLGSDARLGGVQFVDALRADPKVTIVHQTPEFAR
jgi:hypothetical protein